MSSLQLMSNWSCTVSTPASSKECVGCCALMSRLACRYAFWDIYDDIGLPGGIPLHSFAASWTRHCLAFDSNDHSRLPKPTGWLLPLVIRCSYCRRRCARDTDQCTQLCMLS